MISAFYDLGSFHLLLMPSSTEFAAVNNDNQITSDEQNFASSYLMLVANRFYSNNSLSEEYPESSSPRISVTRLFRSMVAIASFAYVRENQTKKNIQSCDTRAAAKQMKSERDNR